MFSKVAYTINITSHANECSLFSHFMRQKTPALCSVAHPPFKLPLYTLRLPDSHDHAFNPVFNKWKDAGAVPQNLSFICNKDITRVPIQLSHTVHMTQKRQTMDSRSLGKAEEGTWFLFEQFAHHQRKPFDAMAISQRIHYATTLEISQAAWETRTSCWTWGDYMRFTSVMSCLRRTILASRR